jgi:hypothetical protein
MTGEITDERALDAAVQGVAGVVALVGNPGAGTKEDHVFSSPDLAATTAAR